jgi:APA family basic amino acid/polyamine antiporter
MTWLGPRVIMAMGEDHWLLRFLGRKNSQGVPVNAALVQLLIVNLFFMKSFQTVVIYIQFSLLLCSLLTVVGVIVLRWTHPEIIRPYRVWAYPVPPLVFAAITIWMMIFLLRSHPAESLSGLATMLVGFALYFFTGRQFRKAA